MNVYNYLIISQLHNLKSNPTLSFFNWNNWNWNSQPFLPFYHFTFLPFLYKVSEFSRFSASVRISRMRSGPIRSVITSIGSTTNAFCQSMPSQANTFSVSWYAWSRTGAKQEHHTSFRRDILGHLPDLVEHVSVLVRHTITSFLYLWAMMRVSESYQACMNCRDSQP